MNIDARHIDPRDVSQEEDARSLTRFSGHLV